MGARTFAQINCSILRSRKLRGLGHAERWAYLCTHLTPQAGFTGIFHYPIALWAADAGIDEGKLGQAISRLTDAGLIEWDADEELVRVIGVHRQRPPENASRAIGLIQDFIDLTNTLEPETGNMILRGASELVAASVARAQRWDPEKGEFDKLRNALGDFLRRTYQEFDDRLLDALQTEMQASNKAAKAEIGSLLPPLTDYQQNTVCTPSAHPAGTRDLDETIRRLDHDQTEKNTKTAQELANHPTPGSPQAELSKKRGTSNGQYIGSRIRPLETTVRSALADKARGDYGL